MSLRVALLLLSLFFFSAFKFQVVVAQIIAPICNSSAAWQWAFNSLNQSPCTVLVNMMSTCNGGTYDLWQLQPTWDYPGPHGDDNSNLCVCSTVGYSLFSACAACQGPGTQWLTWSAWITNCTRTLPPSSFPNPVPFAIRVPQWVLIDITNENYWNPNQSRSVGDSPEVRPGAIIGPSLVSTSPSTSPTGSPTHSHNSSTGAIVGGVVGGIVAVAAISIAVFVFFCLRRRSRAQASGAGASSPPMDETEQSLAEGGANMGSSLPLASLVPWTPGEPIRLYDPNDPTTFPAYQGDPQSLTAPQGPVPSHNGTGSSLVSMQTSRPEGLGYHGFPVPTV